MHSLLHFGIQIDKLEQVLKELAYANESVIPHHVLMSLLPFADQAVLLASSLGRF